LKNKQNGKEKVIERRDTGVSASHDVLLEEDFREGHEYTKETTVCFLLFLEATVMQCVFLSKFLFVAPLLGEETKRKRRKSIFHFGACRGVFFYFSKKKNAFSKKVQLWSNNNRRK
jgi:hypothetical protein